MPQIYSQGLGLHPSCRMMVSFNDFHGFVAASPLLVTSSETAWRGRVQPASSEHCGAARTTYAVVLKGHSNDNISLVGGASTNISRHLMVDNSKIIAVTFQGAPRSVGAGLQWRGAGSPELSTWIGQC